MAHASHIVRGRFSLGQELRPPETRVGCFADGQRELPLDACAGRFSRGQESAPADDDGEGSFAGTITPDGRAAAR
jgi:hypothetical protein